MGSDVVNMTEQQAIVQLATKGIAIVSRTIGTPVQTGAGLDDFSNGGEFTGNSDIVYEVEIDLAAATDTFTWSKDGVVQASSVAITGVDQALDNGITIKFAATTGHTLADKWTFTAKSADPTSIQKVVSEVITSSIVPSGTATSEPIDCRQIESAILTSRATFDNGSTDGMTVEIYASPDGLVWDTQPWAEDLEPAFVTNTTQQITNNLDALPSFLRVKITNLDAVKDLQNPITTFTKVEK